jgi:hypothetical protein
MHKVNTTLNMLGASEDMGPTCCWIHSLKLRRMKIFKGLLYHTLNFILSNYNSLYLTANKSLDREVRTSALSALREELLKDYSELQGDMTRPINALLAEIKIHLTHSELRFRHG